MAFSTSGSRAVFWLLQALLLISQCYAAAIRPMSRQESSDGQWWREPFGMLQTNLREIDADMDVDEVADYIDRFGANAWLIGVGGILAQYPTDLDFQMRNPYLANRTSGDLIQDAMDAARARGLKLLARMDFSKVQAKVANEHPEWLYRDPEGNTQNHTAGLVSVCPSGQYYQERIFDILDEVIRRYKVDGFFVNWSSFNEEDYYKVYHGVCHCDNCQKRWKDFTPDAELPNGPDDPTYNQWQNFSGEIIDDWTGRVSKLIGEKLPDAGLMLGDSADIMFHEANNAIDREMWHHRTSESVSKWISYKPDTPVIVNSVSFVDMPYRMGSEEPAQFAQYLLQTISRGANPSTYIMGVPSKIPYLNLETGIAAEITTFHKNWKEVYNGLRPTAKTALVVADDTQMSSEQYDNSTSEFRGLYSAMQELHVPFDVIAQERITTMADNEGLKRYEVLILPDLGPLASGDVKALDDWVASGGRLIATGSSGVDEDGNVQLQSLPSSRQQEVINEREKLFSTYFAPPQNRTEQNYYVNPIIPITGAYHKFEWKNGTEGRYKLLAFGAFAPPEYAYGNVQVDERGAGIGKYENGKGIVIPFTIGRGYWELGLSVFRDFYEMILKEDGAAQEPLQFNIAEQIEVTVNKNAEKTVVHLINMSGMRHQNFGKTLPIPAGSIKGGESEITAHALVSNRTLEVKDGEIQLPGLDLFEVVVIEGLE